MDSHVFYEKIKRKNPRNGKIKTETSPAKKRKQHENEEIDVLEADPVIKIELTGQRARPSSKQRSYTQQAEIESDMRYKILKQ